MDLVQLYNQITVDREVWIKEKEEEVKRQMIRSSIILTVFKLFPRIFILSKDPLITTVLVIKDVQETTAALKLRWAWLLSNQLVRPKSVIQVIKVARVERAKRVIWAMQVLQVILILNSLTVQVPKWLLRRKPQLNLILQVSVEILKIHSQFVLAVKKTNQINSMRKLRMLTQTRKS